MFLNYFTQEMTYIKDTEIKSSLGMNKPGCGGGIGGLVKQVVSSSCDYELWPARFLCPWGFPSEILG